MCRLFESSESLESTEARAEPHRGLSRRVVQSHFDSCTVRVTVTGMPLRPVLPASESELDSTLKAGGGSGGCCGGSPGPAGGVVLVTSFKFLSPRAGPSSLADSEALTRTQRVRAESDSKLRVNSM